ncbi:sensor domain-containing phosphodiesterase [Vreelandella lutescens]|uniref:EAL domain-containing protein n=1 Tax=Vreelandella lutescens TaxID=1602943 RepID=A0ABQ1PDF1_9GAMM|nr:EAL domain-containing protein [Halomonas lutescens]GGC95018.1 hypothetical protein GCM10011382_26800 [Halomonas lutescens]
MRMTRHIHGEWLTKRRGIPLCLAFATWWLAAVTTTLLFPPMDSTLPISPIWAANALAYGAILVGGLRWVPAFALAALVWNVVRGDSIGEIIVGMTAFVLMLLWVAWLSHSLQQHVRRDRARRLLAVPLIALMSASVFAGLGAWQFSDGPPSQSLWMALWLSETVSVLLFAPLAQQICHYGVKNTFLSIHFKHWPLWLWMGVAISALLALLQLGNGTTLWHLGAPYLAVTVPIMAVYWLPSTLARTAIALFVTLWLLVNVSLATQPTISFDVLAWLDRQWVIFIASLVGFLSIESVRSAEAASRRLTLLRLKDPVTGLANELGVAELAQHLSLEHVSVIGVQLPYTDELVALVGDDTVQRIERQIADQLRSQNADDIVKIARLRPGLFALVMKHTPNAQHRTLAERLATQLSSERSGMEIPGTHLGITVVMLPNVQVSEFSSMAALLLTACRHAQRNPQESLYHYHGTTAELIAQQSQEAAWIHRLRAALGGDTRQGKLLLYAQPIVSRREPTQCRCEILLRWQSIDGHVLSPQAFLPIAETFGLMPQVDRWVLENTLFALSQHPNGHRLSSVSVNLSGDSLNCDWLVDVVDELMSRYEWPPQRLCLELTESATIQDTQAASLSLQQLQRMGVCLAIDDFGTGRATFAYLKQYHAQELKIDGAFIRDLESSAFDREVVRATCTLAQQLSVSLVAEFVENDKQVMLLEALGIDYLQGYGLSPPMPLDEYLSCIDVLADKWQAQFNTLPVLSSE